LIKSLEQETTMNRTLVHPAPSPAVATPSGSTAPGASGGTSRGLGDVSPRLAGAAALSFVAVVVAQNVIRGGSAPSNGASAEDVLAYYADHRPITFLLAATFLVGGGALATFLGGVTRRLTAGARPAAAYTGLVGGIGVISLFSILVATEEALSVVAHGRDPDLGAIQALWAVHNSVFTVLFVSLGVALVGLARAGVGAGLTHRRFDWLAPLGAGLLGVAAVAGPAIAGGDAVPLFGVGVLGFLVWLAFLTTTGLRLVRTQEMAA
jgi:hypothetical protein